MFSLRRNVFFILVPFCFIFGCGGSQTFRFSVLPETPAKINLSIPEGGNSQSSFDCETPCELELEPSFTPVTINIIAQDYYPASFSFSLLDLYRGMSVEEENRRSFVIPLVKRDISRLNSLACGSVATHSPHCHHRRPRGHCQNPHAFGYCQFNSGLAEWKA